jgi:hypothetical protein
MAKGEQNQACGDGVSWRSAVIGLSIIDRGRLRAVTNAMLGVAGLTGC